MLVVAYLLIIFSLVVIIIQDFKQREISWLLIPTVLTGFICKAVFYKNNVIADFLFNTVFILIQLIGLTVYFSFKNKRFLNIINSYLGLGDVLFILVVCFVFSTVNFMLFYLGSMILTLAGILIYNALSTKRPKDIPLAGAMAGILLLLVLTTILFPEMDFYNDVYFLNMLHNQ